MNKYKYALIVIIAAFISGAFILYSSLVKYNNPTEAGVSINSQNLTTWKSYASTAWGVSYQVPKLWYYRLGSCPKDCSPTSFVTSEDFRSEFYTYYGMREAMSESFTTHDPELYKQPFSTSDNRLSFDISYLQKAPEFDPVRDLKELTLHFGKKLEDISLSPEPDVIIGNVKGWEFVEDSTQDPITSVRMYGKTYIIEREGILFRLQFLTATEEFYRQYESTINRILSSVIISDIKNYSRPDEFSLTYSTGWLQNSIDNQINAIPNAGPMSGVELLPTEPVGATTASFQAYQYTYNQAESLTAIAGLLPDITTADIPHTINDIVIQNITAVHVVVDGQGASESFYKSDYYLLRTSADTVLQLSMRYPTISDYNSYHTQMDTIVDSLRLL